MQATTQGIQSTEGELLTQYIGPCKAPWQTAAWHSWRDEEWRFWGAAIMVLNIIIPNLEMKKLRYRTIKYTSHGTQLSINRADIWSQCTLILKHVLKLAEIIFHLP